MQTDAEQIVQRIRQVLARYQDVQAAYLFGSYARGTAGPASDIDLALVGPRGDLSAQKADILADLTVAGFDRVDLVLLDGADTVLQFEAVHTNCLAYARPEFDHGSYFSRTIREYFDFEPYLKIQRKALKQRILHGQT